MPGFECSICLETLNSQHKHILSCKHSFCKKCISKWRYKNTKCPLCRARIWPEDRVKTRNRNEKESRIEIERFLHLFLEEKIKITERNFDFYFEIVNLFLLYPYIFFGDSQLRTFICDFMGLIKERVVIGNWSSKEKTVMSNLEFCINNLSSLYSQSVEDS